MLLRRFSLLAVLVALAGCAGGEGPRLGGGDVNFAAGSRLADTMSGRDVAALHEVFLTAIERGETGATRQWSSGSFQGSVTPGQYLVGNLKPDPATLLPVRGRLELNHAFQTEQGLHALTRNANLRAGPSTDAPVLATLDAGTGVDVVGKLVGQPWMLVAIDGAIRGYVHDSLMIKQPGRELELAGGPTRRAHFCRAFSQSLSAYGQTDRWDGAACDRGEGWRLEPRPENEPERLF